MQAGIVGLPNAGKTTLFNALTSHQAEVADYPFTTINPNFAEVNISDERLLTLTNLLNPQEIRPARLKFLDIAGLVRGAHRGEGLGNEFLNHIRTVEVIVNVLRCFPIINVSHVEGSINPIRDFEIVRLELALSDLALLERAIHKLKKISKVARKEDLMELDFLESVYLKINQGKEIEEADSYLLKKYNLLSLKPSLSVINVSEDEFRNPSKEFLEIKSYLENQGIDFIISPALLEQELSAFSPEDRLEYLEGIGVKGTSLNQLIFKTNKLLQRIFFYTTASRILQAWPIKKGTVIKEAARMIHTDIGEGLIKAEVIPFNDLLRVGSLNKARENGLVKIEGKDAVVEDGDVIYFHFR
ncbi:MAG: Ribosome-binding ATPase YchF [candidate division WS2 bacterium]|uniref:Ribosome-binding ATPase YchF n=1 Tax=Psychracetigena formicireducens TaxID=2986056 RepID=A0A9E2BGD6_PSYF1|nr:Ribosome-binding ATPase YchF [Candidatus Psychracetigena formicireducens]MBT9145098.1 Ribosome-binding ATPase YchF [Candidatus Psychracetigena formicireducens]